MDTQITTQTLRRAQIKALISCLEEARDRFKPKRVALYRYSNLGEPGMEKTYGFGDTESEVNWDLLLQCCHERNMLVQDLDAHKLLLFPVVMAGSENLMAILYFEVSNTNSAFRSDEIYAIDALISRASAEIALARKRLLIEKERVLPAPDQVDTWAGIRRAGLEAFKAGVTEMALSFLERARDMAKDWGPCPELATSLNDFGEVLRAVDRKQEAAQQFEQGISVLEQSGLENEKQAVVLLNNFAGILYAERELEEAEVFYRRALEIATNLRPEPKATPAIFSNLGVISVELGDRATAEVWMQQAVESAGRLFGDDHAHTVKCQQKLEALKASS